MMQRSSIALGAILLALLVGAAEAREITKAERAALVERLEGFSLATQAKDPVGLVSIIPAGVMAAQAKAVGISVKQLTASAETAIGMALARMELLSFSMPLEEARYEELSDGTPYVMIPTETVTRADGETIRTTSETLAMLDGGVWYLVRVSEATQVDMLKQVYPGFAEVDFPAGTVEAVE